MEQMALCQDIKVQEVLDFTILEQLVDKGHDKLQECKKYMGRNTLQHCEKIEQYFFKLIMIILRYFSFLNSISSFMLVGFLVSAKIDNIFYTVVDMCSVEKLV